MFSITWKQIAAGKTPARAFMNEALRRHALVPGIVLDLGGGKRPSYLSYVRPHGEARMRVLDKQHGTGADAEVDFECDAIPYDDASVDQVLLLNVLEHIYNHQHLLSEIRRILKPGSSMIGFVPFLVNYHPDPHDFFRYTDETLARLCAGAGFAQVSIRAIGLGPFMVNCNTLASFMPCWWNALMFPFSYALDRIVLRFRPGLRARFPLGYLWTATA
jgi:SAM-dependent methyltransferase